MTEITRILVIDDDAGMALALYRSLTDTYKVDTAKTGVSGLKKAAAQNYQAIILDLNLPDMSGLQVCRMLRHEGILVPILVLSGESGVVSKVTLLDAGANDYLTKPFSLEELRARLRVLLRQVGVKPPINKLVSGELILDPNKQQVERDGHTIVLRRKEFAILECLMQHAGSVVTRETLLNYAWEGNEITWTNTVDVHIKYLRDKIDRPFGKPLIKTVHGIGYKLDIPRVVAKIHERR